MSMCCDKEDHDRAERLRTMAWLIEGQAYLSPQTKAEIVAQLREIASGIDIEGMANA